MLNVAEGVVEGVNMPMIIYPFGMLLGIALGLLTYRGYMVTKSPTMLRLSIAFVSIGLGFMMDMVNIYTGEYSMVSTTFSAVGNAFIALAYSVQKALKYIVPLLTIITFSIYP
ncbi:MAG: hypothetical protein QW053_03895, partial [Candidatus Nitrosocaldus sp.]